jgi:hypothetical protein
MASELEKKKRIVVIVYALVFVTMFSLAAAVAINRRIEDARHAKDTTAPVGSAAEVAPVASR